MLRLTFALAAFVQCIVSQPNLVTCNTRNTGSYAASVSSRTWNKPPLYPKFSLTELGGEENLVGGPSSTAKFESLVFRYNAVPREPTKTIVRCLEQSDWDEMKNENCKRTKWLYQQSFAGHGDLVMEFAGIKEPLILLANSFSGTTVEKIKFPSMPLRSAGNDGRPSAWRRLGHFISKYSSCLTVATQSEFVPLVADDRGYGGSQRLKRQQGGIRVDPVGTPGTADDGITQVNLKLLRKLLTIRGGGTKAVEEYVAIGLRPVASTVGREVSRTLFEKYPLIGVLEGLKEASQKCASKRPTDLFENEDCSV